MDPQRVQAMRLALRQLRKGDNVYEGLPSGIDVPEHMQTGGQMRMAGRAAAADAMDDSERATAATAGAAGATVGDLYDDDEDD